MSNRNTQIAVALLAGLGCPASLACAQEYTVTDLGQIAGIIAPSDLVAVGVSNVVGCGVDPEAPLPCVSIGTFTDDQGNMSAARWVATLQGQQIGGLGTLGGTQTLVSDVNFYPNSPNTGTRVVGAAMIPGDLVHAFSYSQAGGMIDLGTLGGSVYWAKGINDMRRIVGWSTDAGEQQHGFIYEDGVMQDLNLLAGITGLSAANAINNAGHIVGQLFAVGNVHAASFIQDLDGIIMPLDLGTLGGISSEALSIAEPPVKGVTTPPDKQFVAGWSDTSGGTRHAVVWEVDVLSGITSPCDIQTLGGLNSMALDVENFDSIIMPIEVVGVSDIAPPLAARKAGGVVTEHAFVWNATQGIRDLNDLIDPLSGWELIKAQSINTSGMISGLGMLNGVWHAFLLEPTAGPILACPADSDGDGMVGIDDFLAVLAQWGACP